MGQFFYNKLRHPDVIYSRCFTHASWVLACMLSRCMIKWELRVARFHAWGFFTSMAGNKAGKKTQVSSMMWINGQGEFFIWMNNICSRRLLYAWTFEFLSKKTLHSGIELISEFPKEWLIITKILFCRVSYCSCLFGEFAKVFERQVWCRTNSSFA